MKLSHILFALLTLSAICSVNAGQVDPVVRIADDAWVGESTLLRFPSRVHAIVFTGDLDPGAAVTVWWRIYNRPQHCAMPYACEVGDLDNPAVDGSQLQATAFVVDDAGGDATVVATLYRTSPRAQGGVPLDESFTEGYLNGRGLRRPMNAEVELLFASHGRLADPGVAGEEAAQEQLLTPGGTLIDCLDPAAPTSSRAFRCGVIQKVDHAAVD
jgi:hypothetical protein